MENRIMVAAAIAFMLVGFVIGIPVGRGCKKCPEIITGVKDTSITVTDTADTVKTVKDSSEIKVEKRIVKRIRKKPVIIEENPDTVPEEVETTCHSWDEEQDDGAYIECTLCSDSLPSSVVNSQAEIDYKAPPETVKTIVQIDTVREEVEVKKPLHKDWRTYVFGTIVALLAGLLASR